MRRRGLPRNDTLALRYGFCRQKAIVLHDLSRIPVTETQRLRLRGPGECDLDAFAAMMTDAEVGQFKSFGRGASREQGWVRITGVLRLLFAHHVHHLTPAQEYASAVDGLETEHQPDWPFDGPMILFNPIV